MTCWFEFSRFNLSVYGNYGPGVGIPLHDGERPVLPERRVYERDFGAGSAVHDGSSTDCVLARSEFRPWPEIAMEFAFSRFLCVFVMHFHIFAH